MKKSSKLGLMIVVLTIISIISVLPVTYTIYKSEENIEINTVSGELIYDVILDKSDTYLDEETQNPYFLITVKNNKDNNLSDADLEYNIEIKNKEGSNGLYSYQTEEGTFTEPTSIINISGSILKETPSEKTYKIIVSSKAIEETNVEYDINYNISQKRMDT